MNLLNKKSPVDLDQLRAAIEDEPGLAQYAPKRSVGVTDPVERMPLEIIAQAITRLTWADAEAMGAAITAGLGNEQDFAKRSVTAAIQAWAKDFQT